MVRPYWDSPFCISIHLFMVQEAAENVYIGVRMLQQGSSNIGETVALVTKAASQHSRGM